jgi:hypothetical protein
MDQFLLFEEAVEGVAGDDELGVVVLQQGPVLLVEGFQPRRKYLNRIVPSLR